MADTEEVPAVPSRATSITKREKWFAITMLALLVVGVAGCLLSQYLQQQAYVRGQRQAGQLVEARLCRVLDPLTGIARLKPPPGNAQDNPSRVYEQQLAATLAPLAQLGPAVGCR